MPNCDFLIAGVQKAGTTTLWALLREHPSIFIPNRKEIHFFDRHDEAFWQAPDYSIYDKKFAEKLDGQIAGDATPIYIYWPGSLEKIKTYNPDIKIIVILRNPVDRAYSHWRMEYSRGKDHVPFKVAIRLETVRLSQESSANSENNRVFSYVKRGMYSQQIAKLNALFPARQVFIRPFDDLVNSHEKLLDEICDFLEVPRYAEHPKNRVEHPKNRVVERETTSEHLKPMEEEVRRHLEEIFREDLRATETMTGLSLSHWLTTPTTPEPKQYRNSFI